MFRELAEYEEYAQMLKDKKTEHADTMFDESHYKVDGPAVILVPAGYRAAVYMIKVGT